MEGDDEYVWDHYENSVKVIIVEESSVYILMGVK